MKKSFRYNVKGKGLGVHSEFFKTLIQNTSHWNGKLNLPKPETQAELTLLSKFIFGVELSMRFEYCQDWLEKEILQSKDLKFKRYLKLMKINDDGKDYIPRHSSTMNRENKMILLYLRYFCNQKHIDYYDHYFNYDVFHSDYELDTYFWRHCLGELSCGGIGGSSYGQVEVTSLKERQRILNMFKGTEGIREEFQKEIDELIEKDKQYDNI